MEEAEVTVDQVCPACGADEFRVYHYLRQGHHDRLYLECAKCGHFAGRVIVHAFVDPDEQMEYHRFLKKAQKEDNMSARKTMQDFAEHSERAKSQFEHIKNSQKQTTSKEKSIRDWFDEFHVKEDG